MKGAGSITFPAKKLLVEGAAVIALLLIVFTTFCAAYKKTTWESWQVPVIYGGDAWLILAMSKAYETGEISPVAEQEVRSLNAPFAGNWNDWPFTEDMLTALPGYAARVLGLFSAVNLALLAAHLLAAVSFYGVCRFLKYQIPFACACALAFALSRFGFLRSVPHLVLTYYWHIPLCILISWWAISREEVVTLSRRWWFSVGIALLTGFQNPYFSSMFIQLLGFATLLHLVRGNWRRAPFPLLLGSLTMASFVLMNLNTMAFKWQHGPNDAAVARSLAGLELYGLKLIELFLPSTHRWTWFAELAQRKYFEITTVRGELGSSYLGFVGITGFLWLIFHSLYRLLQGRLNGIPTAAWQSIWIILYALLGGINLAVGVIGIVLFRGTNRYSIFLLALSLLFLARQLSRHSPRWLAWPLAIFLAAVAIWDQVPEVVTREQLETVRRYVQSDRDLIGEIEKRLPPGAMVFQLPVMDFPEVPPTLGVADYENFRPYFFSHNLRFSYGSDKGRARESWQRDVEQLSPAEIPKRLADYGFSAILINRKGYADQGHALINAIQPAVHGQVESSTQDMICEFLEPATNPQTPLSHPILASGFYGWEGDPAAGAHAWAMGDAAISIYSDQTQALQRQLHFSIWSLTERTVSVVLGTAKKTIKLHAGTVQDVSMNVRVQAGDNTLTFHTDTPAATPPGGDLRRLSFAVAKLSLDTDRP